MLGSLLRHLAARAGFALRLSWLKLRGAPREHVLKLGDEALQRREFGKALPLYDLASANGWPTRLYRNGFMDEERRASGEAYVHTLRDVTLDADRCAVFDRGVLYFWETSTRNLLNHAGLFVRATEDLSHFVVGAPAPRATYEHPVALIGTDGANYSHWILFNVLKLPLLERAGVLQRLPLLINDALKPWQAEMLDFLGIAPERRLLVQPEGVLAFRELVVPTAPTRVPQVRAAAAWLRERYRPALQHHSGGPKRLYVSRVSGHRNFVNRAELETRLEREGFEAVTLAGRSVAEQAALFAGAEIIVAPHEAGLANLVFASPGCRVVEITNTHMARMGMFKNLAEAVGARIHRVVSERFAEGHTPLPYRDFHVDVDEVQRAIHAG